MNVLVSASARFALTPDNRLWSNSGPLSYRFWSRYLDVYENVYLLVRAQQCDDPPEGATLASGDHVYPAVLPYYYGPKQYLVRYLALQGALKKINLNNLAIQLRAPSVESRMITGRLPKGRPFGLEVVGDPYDVFAPGAVRHPLRPFFRYWFSRRLGHQCAHASAVAYVTEHALQRRYPPAPGVFSTHYSSIELVDDAFAFAPRSFSVLPSPITLITVGTLAQLYKAQDVLIDAVAACVQSGLDLKLVIVGDGKHRPELETRAARLRLGERVIFTGQLPAGQAVRDQLDQADIFLLASKQEGLPRAMIEAMARGLPCIGSTVGGIPELLQPEDMVTPGNAEALAIKIREVATNPERMAQMSAHNLDKAKEYREDVLRARRREFYMHVKELTRAWLTKQ